MKKKTLAILLVSAMAVGMLTGCGSSKAPEPAPAPAAEEAPAAEAEAPAEEAPAEEAASTAAASSEADAPAPSGDVTMAETVIYDEGGITVTATGIELNDWDEWEIPVTIVNNTDQNIKVSTEYDSESVNGIMNDLYLYVDVAAGKTAMDEISMYDLADAGIDTPAVIEFALSITDDDYNDLNDDSIIYTLVTSAGEDYEQAIDDSGDVLFDDAGIVVKAHDLVADDYYAGVFEVYVENNSGQDIEVSASDVSVNDIMSDAYLGGTVRDGKIAYLTFSIDDDNFTFDDITSMEFVLKFRDDDWNTIAESDIIGVTFE